ncbi:transporter substrate-binding domain-containing protein [Dasania marina]|uniref:substrate-binding periplasmic protein n=1 Tax=Dasania marina TaxID=471499 RepID=UPI0030DC8BB0
MIVRILLVVMLWVCAHVSFAQSVSIRTDEWFPMNGTPGQKPAGFLIDFAERTFDSVDYKLMSWQRAVEEVKNGSFDCVIGAFKEDAPGFVFPEESWGVNQTAVYVRSADSWSYQGVDSLLARKVGIIKGYSYEEEIDALVKTRKDVFKALSGVDALEKNFKKLAAGRIDTLVESEPVANAKILQMGLSGKIKRVGHTNLPQPMYIACSPAKASSKKLVKRVDTVIRELRASGELEKIMNQYGLTDWK